MDNKISDSALMKVPGQMSKRDLMNHHNSVRMNSPAKNKLVPTPQKERNRRQTALYTNPPVFVNETESVGYPSGSKVKFD